jgi:hypothetical protein
MFIYIYTQKVQEENEEEEVEEAEDYKSFSMDGRALCVVGRVDKLLFKS